MSTERNFPGARHIICHIHVGLPDTGDAEQCSTCGFDAVLKFPLTSLSEDGVSNFGHYKVCVRCADMAEEDE